MKTGDLLKAAREFFDYAEDVKSDKFLNTKGYYLASGRFVLRFNDGSYIALSQGCTGMLIDELCEACGGPNLPLAGDDPLVSACLDGLDFAYFNPSSVLYAKAVWDLKK